MKYFCVSIVFFLFGNVLTGPVGKNDGFTLRIVHTNDMHARFEQTSALSTKCLDKDEKAGKCYGGFARLATLIRQARASSLPTLFLNAGDTYQGTTWFTIHKWKIVAKFLTLLAPDAISLGNHEFDDGPEGLVPFLNATEFPVLTANLDLSQEPELAASRLQNSVILNVTGHKIGVIGYLTPDTKAISQTGNVKFLDEIPAIRKEVQRLQEQGVKILIALGHSGFAMDKRIAAEVEGIDLVIGGHTNTFLYTGSKPDLEAPEGLYPTEVVQKSGRKVYVVQAYAYTKYLGNLTVDFDAQGEIGKIVGDPVLVDARIEQAKDILEELDQWRPAIQALQNKSVGSAKVLLDGNSKNCRWKECNFGNLITDAMIESNAREYAGDEGWTDAPIAIHNSGSLRASIDREPDDNIAMSDIVAALPFNNGIGKIKITGRQLKEVLEWSVHDLIYNHTGDLRGAFIHFSGLQVDYDLSRPNGARAVAVQARCGSCRIPSFEPLNNDETYTILATDFLHAGGDQYEMLKELPWTALGVTTDQAVATYIRRHSPVYPGVEWRINYVSTGPKIEDPVVDDHDNVIGAANVFSSVTLMMLIPTVALILGR
ncbi:protein 5NUC-like [Diachasmimorpha longicaudata]|uniref:protein 5NUC-like n=1 Tax=Diachasmimorpha longicaudata TaxID=58733 RepID=UPI0030B870A1